MTRPLLLAIPPILFASALAVPTAAEAGGPAERAVAACRAEMFGAFPDGTVRTHRIAEIAGNARRTRVTIAVRADRRYTFECAADRDGRIVTAAFDPPREEPRRLAAGQR